MSRVSYVMMNDGGDRAAHRRGAPGDRRTDRRAARRRRRPTRSGARRRDRRQPDHAPPRARHRSHAARQRSVHAGDERRGRRARATDIGLDLPFASFYAGPCIAGHVGADAAAMVLAEGPHRGDGDAARRRHRHQRRDRPRRPPPPVRRVEPDGSGVRRRPDQLRTAGDGRSGGGGAHRPADAGRRRQGDRRRPVERRAGLRSRRSPTTGVTGLCGSGIIDLLAEMYLAGLLDADGTIVGANAGTDRSGRGRRADVPLRVLPRRASRAVGHPERRAGGATRQGGAAGRYRPAARARRQPDGHRHPPRRCLRRAHRPAARDGPRARPRLPARRRPLRRQRRGCRRGDGPAVGVGPTRDGGRRARHRQDRDGDRAALPGAVRRGDGDPPRLGTVRPPRRAGHPAASPSDGAPRLARRRR